MLPARYCLAAVSPALITFTIISLVVAGLLPALVRSKPMSDRVGKSPSSLAGVAVVHLNLARI